MSEWRTKLGKAVRIVSEAAEVAVLASSNPGIVGITAIAAKALNSFNEMTSQGASQYFRRGWVHQNVGFSSVLLKLAKDAGFVREVTTAHDKGMGGTVWVGEVHG